MIRDSLQDEKFLRDGAAGFLKSFNPVDPPFMSGPVFETFVEMDVMSVLEGTIEGGSQIISKQRILFLETVVVRTYSRIRQQDDNRRVWIPKKRLGKKFVRKKSWMTVMVVGYGLGIAWEDIRC